MATRFLETRDRNYDLCRTYLVVTMIISHTFSWYYGGEYSASMTVTSQSGFIFIAGFTSAVLYGRRVAVDHDRIRSKLFRRCYRLLALFCILNLLVLIVRPDRLARLIHEYTPLGIVFRVILLREDPRLISFDMLVPIALTSMVSWFLIRSLRPRASLLLAVSIILCLFALEITGTFNYYGVRFTGLGIVGCLAGIVMSTAPWNRIRKRLLSRSATVLAAACALIYYTLICLYSDRHTPVFHSLHLFPTVLNLVLVYQLGSRMPLESDGLLQRLNAVTAENMLFAYVAHLMIIYLLSSIFAVGAYTFFLTLTIAGAIALATGAACVCAVWCSGRSALTKGAYSYLFK